MCVTKKDQKFLEAEIRNRYYRETREPGEQVQHIERELDEISQRRQEIQNLHADPAFYSDGKRIREIGLEDKSLAQRYQELMEIWESLQLQLDEARRRFDQEMAGIGTESEG